MSNTSSAAGCGTNISAGIGPSGERPAPSGKRRASAFWRDALRTSAECRRGKAPGEPYDGKRHVRFDEGTLETEQWARLRHRHLAKAAGQQSSLAPNVTAPASYSANRQRPQQTAEQPATESQAGAAGNLDGRDQDGCACRLRRLRRDLACQIRQGGRMPDQGSL